MPLEADLSALAQALRAPVPVFAPNAAFAPRVEVYRTLVRDRFIGSVSTTLPNTYALLGAERTARMMDAFLLSQGVHSPYFRDVAGEIARFMESAAAALVLTDHEVDSARYEAMRFAVHIAPADEAVPSAPLALDRGVCFARAMCLFSGRSAVHRVPAESTPARTQLLLYRESKRVHVLELSEAAFAILNELRAGHTLAAGIQRGAAQTSTPLSADVMTEISTLLTDLTQRGVILSAS